MPWVCANCNANNASSHTTCDVCGSDQRLRHELTAPIYVPKRGEKAIPTTVMGMSVERLELSTSTNIILRHAGITTVGQLLRMDESELDAIRYLDEIACKELKEKVYEICLVAGYDPGVMWRSTTTTATHAVAEKPVVSASPTPDHSIDTKSGLIAAAVTSLICYLLFSGGMSTGDPHYSLYLEYWFIPLILATLMYGRVIALVSLPSFIFLSITTTELSFNTLICLSLVPAIVVLSTWYYAKHEWVREVTLSELTGAAIAGVSAGIILIYIAYSNLKWSIILDISINAIILLITVDIWWRIMKRIYPNPEVIVMRHLKP